MWVGGWRTALPASNPFFFIDPDTLYPSLCRCLVLNQLSPPCPKYACVSFPTSLPYPDLHTTCIQFVHPV